MLPNKFEMPLALEVKPSKLFQLYITSLIFISFIGLIMPTSLPLSLRALFVVVFLFVVVRVVKNLKKHQITSLKLSGDNDWEVEVDSKECFDVELTGECIVTSFLIWLNFKEINTQRKSRGGHVLLLRDSADKNLMRQLRVRLRLLKRTKTEEIEI